MMFQIRQKRQKERTSLVKLGKDGTRTNKFFQVQLLLASNIVRSRSRNFKKEQVQKLLLRKMFEEKTKKNPTTITIL